MGQEHGWAVCGNEVKAVTLCSGREFAARPREQQGQKQSEGSNEIHENKGTTAVPALAAVNMNKGLQS